MKLKFTWSQPDCLHTWLNGCFYPSACWWCQSGYRCMDMPMIMLYKVLVLFDVGGLSKSQASAFIDKAWRKRAQSDNLDNILAQCGGQHLHMWVTLCLHVYTYIEFYDNLYDQWNPSRNWSLFLSLYSNYYHVMDMKCSKTVACDGVSYLATSKF